MVHNRQFIISKNPHLIDSSWLSIEVRSGYVISYQKNLRVELSDDKSIALIGDAWQVEPTRKAPHEILKKWNAKTTIDEIYEQEETWSGRYIILTEKYILLDATGNLGLFYGGGEMSSSVSLLRQILGFENSLPYAIHSTDIEGNYMPGPLTMYDGIYKLLPSQIFEIATGKILYRTLLHRIKASDETIYKEFEKIFFHGINSMYQHFSDCEIWLPISGGRDSRVCLAAFEHLKKEYHPYVWRYPNAPSLDAGCHQDIGVAKRLARAVGKRLTVIYRYDSWDDEKQKELVLHTGGMATMSCRWQYPCDTMRPLQERKKKVINVRNNVWEMCTDHYNKRDFNNTPEKIIEQWNGTGERFEESAQEWLRIVERDDKNTDMSFGERVEWELLHGCWLSNGMQGFDIFDNVETINILNCRKYLSLLMSLELNTRRSREYQVKLTNLWYPPFAKVPYGENYSDMYMLLSKYWAKIKRKVKKIISKL